MRMFFLMQFEQENTSVRLFECQEVGKRIWHISFRKTEQNLPERLHQNISATDDFQRLSHSRSKSNSSFLCNIKKTHYLTNSRSDS